MLCDKSFAVAGPRVWNCLPAALRAVEDPSLLPLAAQQANSSRLTRGPATRIRIRIKTVQKAAKTHLFD